MIGFGGDKKTFKNVNNFFEAAIIKCMEKVTLFVYLKKIDIDIHLSVAFFGRIPLALRR